MWPKEREKKGEEEKRLCAHVAICLESTEIGMTNGIQCVPEKREREKYMEVECERSVHHQQEFEIEDADVIKVNHSHSRRCPWTRSLL